jgi:hypothetical protein
LCAEKYISALELRDYKTALNTIKTTMSKFAADKFISTDLLAGFNKLKDAVVEIVKGAE